VQLKSEARREITVASGLVLKLNNHSAEEVVRKTGGDSEQKRKWRPLRADQISAIGPGMWVPNLHHGLTSRLRRVVE
jgi:hypothetical protein